RPMNYVDMRADGAFTVAEVRLDGIEGGVLHHHDHDGRRKNRGQRRILEAIREVVGSDDETKRAFGAYGYRSHVFSRLSCNVDAFATADIVRRHVVDRGSVTLRIDRCASQAVKFIVEQLAVVQAHNRKI